MKNEELKPCPFCGSKEIRLAGYFENNEMVHFVFCYDCGAQTRPTRRGRGTGAEIRLLFEQKAAEALAWIMGRQGIKIVGSEEYE